MTDSQLKAKYMTFCKFGDKENKGTMTSTKFFKFCKDCKIVDKQVTRTKIDLLFTKLKAKGNRVIKFSVFKNKGIPELAKMKYGKTDIPGGVEKLLKLILSGKTKSSGTKADKVKLHDDKKLYTGVYARGGPNTKSTSVTLSQMADRSAADARGVNHKYDKNKQ
mmetsp:Transcript_21971/g.32741  ORF Transcript_21971/g.32741 Transcript_21971/m.32741 type:complete len:164 (+) Transcript_21971:59-550(+)